MDLYGTPLLKGYENMRKRHTAFYVLYLLLVAFFLSSCQKDTTTAYNAVQMGTRTDKSVNDNDLKRNDAVTVEAEVFKEMNEFIVGFAFDNKENMFVGNMNGKILKVTPDGTVTAFADLRQLAGSTEVTAAYSFQMGKDNSLYVSATDRLIKIDENGVMNTIFTGKPYEYIFMTTDQKGNLYVASGNAVYRYTPTLEKTEFVTVDSTITGFERGGCIAGMTFDSNESNFYIATSLEGKIIKYPVSPDGIPEKPVILEGFSDPVYLAPKSNGSIYIVAKDSIIRILKDGTRQTIHCTGLYGDLFSFAFGKKEFGEDNIYTADNTGRIYKICISDAT